MLFSVGLGIGTYTLFYAEGFSYLSDDPEVCVNCHIMQSQYDSWLKASHHDVANCVDCHLPHDFFIGFMDCQHKPFPICCIQDIKL